MIGYISKGAEYIFPLFILFTFVLTAVAQSTEAPFSKRAGVRVVLYANRNA